MHPERTGEQAGDDGRRVDRVRAVRPVLLVGADGSPGAARALSTAAELAWRLGMRVVVGLVQPLPVAGATGEFVVDLQDDLELEVLTQASCALDPGLVPWELAITTGDPAHGLHALAEQHDAALVVIGTRGGGAGPALHRLVRGSVSSHLVHHERRPVLVVPVADDRA